MCQPYDNARKIDVSLKLVVLRFCAFDISHIKNNLTISEMGLPFSEFFMRFLVLGSICTLFFYSIISNETKRSRRP